MLLLYVSKPTKYWNWKEARIEKGNIFSWNYFIMDVVMRMIMMKASFKGLLFKMCSSWKLAAILRYWFRLRMLNYLGSVRNNGETGNCEVKGNFPIQNPVSCGWFCINLL